MLNSLFFFFFHCKHFSICKCFHLSRKLIILYTCYILVFLITMVISTNTSNMPLATRWYRSFLLLCDRDSSIQSYNQFKKNLGWPRYISVTIQEVEVDKCQTCNTCWKIKHESLKSNCHHLHFSLFFKCITVYLLKYFTVYFADDVPSLTSLHF